MLIANGDGTFIPGPLDAIAILHCVSTNTYHSVFFEEVIPPSPPPAMETPTVRLRSKMHHTTGAPTHDEAKRHAAELWTQILVPPESVWLDEVIPWDGSHGVVIFRSNWLIQARKGG